MHHTLVAAAALVVAFFLLAAHPAEATPITYVETASASGSLGAAAFTNQTITLTFAGDTTGAISPVPGFVVNPAGVASVSVAGIGNAVFNAGG